MMHGEKNIKLTGMFRKKGIIAICNSSCLLHDVFYC